MKFRDYTTLFKEKSMREKGAIGDSKHEEGSVPRQVGRDLVPPKNEGGVRKCCWDGEQMVTVARC